MVYGTKHINVYENVKSDMNSVKYTGDLMTANDNSIVDVYGVDHVCNLASDHECNVVPQ